MSRNEPFDIEEIAAYIDGRLIGKEKKRIERLLAESDHAREVMADATRLADNLRSEIRPTSRYKLYFPIGLAAAASIAALMIAPSEPLPANQRLATELASGAGLGAALGSNWAAPPWPVTRGAAAPTAESSIAFKIGVRSLDLTVALETNRMNDVPLLLSELESWLGTIDFGEILAARYAILRTATNVDGANGQRLANQASGIERDVDELLSAGSGPQPVDAFRLGRWAEWIRIAGGLGENTLNHVDWRFKSVRRLEMPDSIAAVVADLQATADDGVDPDEIAEIHRLIVRLFDYNVN